MSAEAVRYLTESELGQTDPEDEGVVSWARVVWIDPTAAADCRSLLNSWIARPCVEGELTWRHNQRYAIPCPATEERCVVKVGDIRPCGTDRRAPR